MKVLYGVQATGNGHISRAIEILPKLQKRVELDILLSGTQGDLPLPFEPKYTCHGFSYIFGTNGGINYFNTFRNLNHKRLIREVQDLPIKEYDLVINDF